jgi:uncharacterized protein YbjT (DUF2867 family)
MSKGPLILVIGATGKFAHLVVPELLRRGRHRARPGGR